MRLLSNALDATPRRTHQLKSPLSFGARAGRINVEKIRRKAMSFFDAKQEIAMLLRNGQLSLDEYEVELKALKYAHGEAMSAQDDQQGVAV